MVICMGLIVIVSKLITFGVFTVQVDVVRVYNIKRDIQYLYSTDIYFFKYF